MDFKRVLGKELKREVSNYMQTKLIEDAVLYTADRL